MSKTYEEFINSRKKVEDLRELAQLYKEDGHYDEIPGYTYFDSYWIVDCKTPEMGFYVMVGVEERYYATIEEAEKFLWDNFVEGECNG